MKLFISLLLFFFICSFSAFAQDAEHPIEKNHEQVQGLSVGRNLEWRLCKKSNC